MSTHTGVWMAAAVLALLPAACMHWPPQVPSEPVVRSITFDVESGSALSLDLSGDGRLLVFDLLGQLWALPGEGGTARALTAAVRDTASDADPSISPDGKWIVFRGDRPAGVGLWLLPTTGGAPRLLASSPDSWVSWKASWAPDSRSVVYVLRDTLRILDIRSGTERAVEVRGLPTAALRDPSYSADGSGILFANASSWSWPTDGGSLWQVPADGGEARRMLPDAVHGVAPVQSPDSRWLAWIGSDNPRHHAAHPGAVSSGSAHVYVARWGDSIPRQVTSHPDLVPSRVRWNGDSRQLVYAADGGLHSVGVNGEAPAAIPFTARIELQRREYRQRLSRTPEPGTAGTARGFMGLGIAPDAHGFAVMALGRLWHVPFGGEPRLVRDLPWTAKGLSWSPDSEHVVWSAGVGGTEDLFVTRIGTGVTRQLTALPGREERATWSPDGRHVAFVHWHPQRDHVPPWRWRGWQPQIRIVAADAERVAAVDGTTDAGAAPSSNWAFDGIVNLGQEHPQWSPASDAVLLHGAEWNDSTALLVPLDGSERRTVPAFPAAATFVSVGRDAVMFLRDNQLWSAPFDSIERGTTHEVLLDAGPALYPSRADDGTILYISPEGLRVRAPDGSTRTIGWPLEFQIAPAPPPLLVQNARLIDGTGAPPREQVDVLLENGRISQIATSGRVAAPPGTRILDAAGRTVVPGFIDLHMHPLDDAVLTAWLAYGVTSGRTLGSAIARSAGMRDAVDAGVISGTRLYLGGFQVNPWPEGGLSGSAAQDVTPEGATRSVALAEAFGADYVKMRMPGSVSSALPLVAAAGKRVMQVSGHCGFSLALAAAGLSGKEHLGTDCDGRYEGQRVYDDVAQLFRLTGMWVVPSLSVYALPEVLYADTALLRGREPHVPATDVQFYWALGYSPTLVEQRAQQAVTARLATARMHRSGVLVGTGPDVMAPGWAVHFEMEQLVLAGLSPLEALTAATGGAARILGVGDLGTLQPGNRADLVILDADPLVDIRNTLRIGEVIQAGRVVDRASLGWFAPAAPDGDALPPPDPLLEAQTTSTSGAHSPPRTTRVGQSAAAGKRSRSARRMRRCEDGQSPTSGSAASAALSDWTQRGSTSASMNCGWTPEPPPVSNTDAPQQEHT
jgi:Tol biopolymer transport system component